MMGGVGKGRHQERPPPHPETRSVGVQPSGTGSCQPQAAVGGSPGRALQAARGAAEG